MASSPMGTAEEPPPFPALHVSPKTPSSKANKKTCSKKRKARELNAQPVSTDGSDPSANNPSNQLVLYEGGATDVVPESEFGLDLNRFMDPRLPNFPLQDSSIKILPSIGTFTAQCAICMKWRIVPTQEKYEEIRQNISVVPFICATAKEWCPDMSCNDPSDIIQDDSRLWAIDKPDIAQTPHGWQRLLRIRSEGSTRFADVYYVAPSGKRLRSMVEIQKYLCDHPEQASQGLNLSQFSFQIPRPMQANYTRKRIATPTGPINRSSLGISMPVEPVDANPLSWADPVAPVELQNFGRDGQEPIPRYFHMAWKMDEDEN